MKVYVVMSVTPRGIMDKKRLPIPNFGNFLCSCVRGNNNQPDNDNSHHVEVDISEDSISNYSMVCTYIEILLTFQD